MVDLIFIIGVTVQTTPEIPDPAAFIAFCEQINRDECRLYKLKESFAVALKEEAEVYLTPVLYYTSVYHKQLQIYNAVPETTQHNYEKDFKFLE